MSTEKIYEKFIGWQRQRGGLEYPDSENLMPMLKTYITPEEAEFLTGFPFKWKTLEQLADIKDVDAEEWIEKAIEVDEMHGMMWYLGRDYALYAELFKRKGDQSKAKENLNKAIEIFKECGADGWVEKYEKELILLA